MRVILPQTPRTWWRPAKPAPHALTLELIGLSVATVVVAIGVTLTCWGRTPQATDVTAALAAGALLELPALRSPEDLASRLPMFAGQERDVAARAIYQRATGDTPLESVNGLGSVTIPAASVTGNPRLTVLRERLERRPTSSGVSVLTAADLAHFRSSTIVRTPEAFTRTITWLALLFFAAFWGAHLVRRWRGAEGDPIVQPVVLLLSGIGLMTMITLRDPLRDTLLATRFVWGIAGGMVLMTAVSLIDLEASRVRRAFLLPLFAAFALAALLLLFGSGPGASTAKVNLIGVQPVEAIRLLVIFALAGFFARRLELLRELSNSPSSRPELRRWVKFPRWRDIQPLAIGMTLVLLFFFLQKDLGPALVLSFVFLGLYGVARGRLVLVLAGIGVLFTAFAVAHAIGFPETVRQRIDIWLAPWNNAVRGGDQIAHGLWALASGAIWGAGPGLGDPQLIPTGHTDFVLAAIGEELGFVGLAAIVGLYSLLGWRCLRIATRAPGHYTALLTIGIALGLIVQVCVIAGGIVGLLPLSGVVSPFLSYGRSSMLCNLIAVGIVLSVSRRQGAERPHLVRQTRVLGAVLAVVAVAIAGRAAWIQVVNADPIATATTLVEQADGAYRFQSNPRLVAAARLLERGTIKDRNGLVLATSKPAEMRAIDTAYRAAGIDAAQTCPPGTSRCYPLGGIGFHVIGDATNETNWAARNSSFLERDYAASLQGFDDHEQLVELLNPKTGKLVRTVRRDYRELLPLLKGRYRPGAPRVEALLARHRDVSSTIDARLQTRAGVALKRRIDQGGFARGAAVVLDVESGEVLAAVSYPWPQASDLTVRGTPAPASARADRLFDRVRYGLYPPGSTFKLLVAAAALRTIAADEDRTFACVRLRDGRVGNYIPGQSRPVRDDVLDRTPHGEVDLHRGLVVSCNAYFAQLALSLGPQPLIDAASLFQIDTARPPTAANVRRVLAHTGYGQGDVVASPLKMARVAAAIAAQGEVKEVRWNPGGGAAAAEAPRLLSTRDAALLARYMREAVTSGTGRPLAANPTPIAGKTGTAEIDTGAAHSWFTGFAPYGGAQRKIAFAAIVENAGYGARSAAPLAGDLVTAAREMGLIQ
jgi:cell division protein FtsW (lipid II flippase)/cell division protein FtsI/penicillin-binding protein 2